MKLEKNNHSFVFSCNEYIYNIANMSVLRRQFKVFLTSCFAPRVLLKANFHACTTLPVLLGTTGTSLQLILADRRHVSGALLHRLEGLSIGISNYEEV